MTYFSIIATCLQIIGLFILALFSFKGIQIKEYNNIYFHSEKATHVSISTKWQLYGRIGLAFLTIGLIMGGIIDIISFTR